MDFFMAVPAQRNNIKPVFFFVTIAVVIMSGLIDVAFSANKIFSGYKISCDYGVGNCGASLKFVWLSFLFFVSKFVDFILVRLFVPIIYGFDFFFIFFPPSFRAISRTFSELLIICVQFSVVFVVAATTLATAPILSLSRVTAQFSELFNRFYFHTPVARFFNHISLTKMPFNLRVQRKSKGRLDFIINMLAEPKQISYMHYSI